MNSKQKNNFAEIDNSIFVEFANKFRGRSPLNFAIWFYEKKYNLDIRTLDAVRLANKIRQALILLKGADWDYNKLLEKDLEKKT